MAPAVAKERPEGSDETEAELTAQFDSVEPSHCEIVDHCIAEVGELAAGDGEVSGVDRAAGALDARTGAYKWHYQVNPGESWDYNASMGMELADLDIDGKRRQVLITAPKKRFLLRHRSDQR
ncbi:hypothetical protein [Novosphingobium sp. BL-52-GroH]|uniref:hypothetical protein n=1 Tax=Novosphingobium sp. BL-52-GroH TaxID=3349877 RepID=UPI00384F19B3